MDDGLYESLVTARLAEHLTAMGFASPDVALVDPGDQPHVLARHVADVVHRHIASVSDESRLGIVNALLDVLDTSDTVLPPARQLRSITRANSIQRVGRYDRRPKTPLSEAALLTNAKDEPSLAAELTAEMRSADSVDLLCAFVKWYGVRLLEDELRALRDAGVPLRVVTTTYLGSTERKALDRMVREFGAEIRIQYDAQRTRLHAKAWLFRRATGFDTAYVGSSNLSRAALLDGVEWNVRLSKIATPSLLQKFEATFDSYWSDPGFERYHPDDDGDRLDDALAEAAGRTEHNRVVISLSGLEVRPYPYQQEMLDEIEAERVVHDRHRNLVVAATGTGKTVVAALDYRRLCDAATRMRPSLLFIAHRKEILEQSLRTYREVLGDANFGELHVAGRRPERWEHIFASVQSLTSYGVENIPADRFAIVVIDEFHHAEASTYRRLLNHLQPTELLGLTATPERADGNDVRRFFGGRTATELRLWEALGADLLCPFHYFATADNTDLRSVTWSRGRYDDAELANLYTGNRARAAIVLGELSDKVLDLASMRAIGFCVSVAHARFMATVFTEAGIPARAVSGDTHSEARRQALEDLRNRRVNVLFAADLLNEGLDLPEVDTVLFLRPTESSTIFLQQLGRGLRRTRDKAVLTVLDFVGQHRKEFRFDQKLRALTGHTRTGLLREIEQGFPFLPSGCRITLDRESEQIVLANIRSQTSQRWSSMVAELRSYGEMTLATFLAESGVELADVLKRGRKSWTQLRRDADLPTATGALHETELLKRVRAFAHVDDPTRAVAYDRLLRADVPVFAELSAAERHLARMVFFLLWPDAGGFASYDEGFAALRHEPAVCSELRAVVDYAFDRSRHTPIGLSGALADLPLRVHARYQREEILSAVGHADMKRKPRDFREGVAYIRERNADIFFVTLKKSEADYSPTTMYRDYPINQELFHWESQSNTAAASPTGRRYLTGTSHVLLFVREQKKDEFGTSPYLFLGPATYVSHQGERPIAITWRLTHRMPADFFNAATVAAS